LKQETLRARHHTMPEERYTGVVKWFSLKKGFGFITQVSDGGEDVYVHYSNIQASATKRRTLADGSPVEFAISDDAQGRRNAKWVTGSNGKNVVSARRRNRYQRQQQREEKEQQATTPIGQACRPPSGTTSRTTSSHTSRTSSTRTSLRSLRNEDPEPDQPTTNLESDMAVATVTASRDSHTRDGQWFPCVLTQDEVDALMKQQKPGDEEEENVPTTIKISKNSFQRRLSYADVVEQNRSPDESPRGSLGIISQSTQTSAKVAERNFQKNDDYFRRRKSDNGDDVIFLDHEKQILRRERSNRNVDFSEKKMERAGSTYRGRPVHQRQGVPGRQRNMQQTFPAKMTRQGRHPPSSALSGRRNTPSSRGDAY